MNVIKTPIKDLLIHEPKIFADDRDYFFESYNKKTQESLRACLKTKLGFTIGDRNYTFELKNGGIKPLNA